MLATALRTVPDTNVLLAAELSRSSASTNKEYFERWQNDEFVLLFSEDTLFEYIEKLHHKQVPEEIVQEFLVALLELGMKVTIEYYHLPVYPDDSDDIAFLLCAENGAATHLITYDRHLLAVGAHYSVKVCRTPAFLADLRQALESSKA